MTQNMEGPIKNIISRLCQKYFSKNQVNLFFLSKKYFLLTIFSNNKKIQENLENNF
jgi:hypothetical protein